MTLWKPLQKWILALSSFKGILQYSTNKYRCKHYILTAIKKTYLLKGNSYKKKPILTISDSIFSANLKPYTNSFSLTIPAAASTWSGSTLLGTGIIFQAQELIVYCLVPELGPETHEKSCGSKTLLVGPWQSGSCHFEHRVKFAKLSENHQFTINDIFKQTVS
jgi:hypothetical protein